MFKARFIIAAAHCSLKSSLRSLLLLWKSCIRDHAFMTSTWKGEGWILKFVTMDSIDFTQEIYCLFLLLVGLWLVTKLFIFVGIINGWPPSKRKLIILFLSFFSWVKTFWLAQNTEAKLTAINKLNNTTRASSVSTFDFSDLYKDTSW